MNDEGKFESLCCSYCDVTFTTPLEMHEHYLSTEHTAVIINDDRTKWKFRPPPRGIVAGEYLLCHNFIETGTCRMGPLCMNAHSKDELEEWVNRFESNLQKYKMVKDDGVQRSSYSECLLEKLAKCTEPLLSEKVEGIEVILNKNATIRASRKQNDCSWILTLYSKFPLCAVCLLNDEHTSYFSIVDITHNINQDYLNDIYISKSEHEWIFSKKENVDSLSEILEYNITVTFRSNIYGTFHQSIVIDHGQVPLLLQKLCVDVMPLEKLVRLEKTNLTILKGAERWTEENIEVVKYHSELFEENKDDSVLLKNYLTPNKEFLLTSTILDKFATRENYIARMHDLLFIEEIERFNLISKFNIETKLQLTKSFALMFSNSTVKFSLPGELFARIVLTTEISKDTSYGRLILNNCSKILLYPKFLQDSGQEKKKVYEAVIEDKTKNEIYLRLSKMTVSELKLHDDQDLKSEVQFQLNRLSLCEMHSAIDHIPSLDLLFPNIENMPSIPWNPSKQWGDKLHLKLNAKQKEALIAVTCPLSVILSPVLIIGPFGTGKTYTMAHAIRCIAEQPATKVLICTHSNSAADLYIREYIHDWVKAGLIDKPLRIYYTKRSMSTVHQDVLNYCILQGNPEQPYFGSPTAEDVMSNRIIITTLSTSRVITELGLPRGVFTHILIDEAAQAMECEALIPLTLAVKETRVVLAGDYMQLSPEVYSQFCEERNLGVSLLERLYDLYPPGFSCKILLVENYRSHAAIVKYTSDLFYDGKLVSKGKHIAHPKLFPLSFFTARGEDVQDLNSVAYFNISEVYEVCEQVDNVIKFWPKDIWGLLDKTTIGVVAPYPDQVIRLRNELRKRRHGKVSVETVQNVQGREFKVLFISTVRTLRTCLQGSSEFDYGFFSNAKLLTTAVTRAQCLVAVVGDPVALCSIGKCRKLWENYIKQCSDANSLFGITWNELRRCLDGVELKKTYKLNPLAPEFIPCLYPPSYFPYPPFTIPQYVMPSYGIMQPFSAPYCVGKPPIIYPSHAAMVGGPYFVAPSQMYLNNSYLTSNVPYSINPCPIQFSNIMVPRISLFPAPVNSNNLSSTLRTEISTSATTNPQYVHNAKISRDNIYESLNSNACANSRFTNSLVDYQVPFLPPTNLSLTDSEKNVEYAKNVHFPLHMQKKLLTKNTAANSAVICRNSVSSQSLASVSDERLLLELNSPLHGSDIIESLNKLICESPEEENPTSSVSANQTKSNISNFCVTGKENSESEKMITVQELEANFLLRKEHSGVVKNSKVQCHERSNLSRNCKNSVYSQSDRSQDSHWLLHDNL